MSWYITNHHKNNKSIESPFLINFIPEYFENKELGIYIDGYLIPRCSIYNEYKDFNQSELIYKLYKKFGFNLIHQIKGIFTLILILNNKFYIFNDRHSLKKYFIYQKDDFFFITNSLNILSESYSLEVDFENAAIFTLLSHFIDGNTLFKNLSSCKPAQLIEFKDNHLQTTSYWSPKNLIKLCKNSKELNILYNNKWKTLIQEYIDFLKPRNISLTITGGNDSRMILAALLSLHEDFHSFTYGNPESNDGSVVKLLKEAAGLDHCFYFIESPSKDWFEREAKKVISYGNSLINIHRAHRNEAVFKENEKLVDLEMIFTGLVGGEYLKEPYYDNIVIPSIFKELLIINDSKRAVELIGDRLELRGINVKNIDLTKIYKKLKVFLDYGNGLNSKQRKFIYTYLFYGCAHHAQDTSVFGQHVKYVVNPFMDIDFLEMIASYKNWYVNNRFNIVNRFFHSVFFVSITDKLAPNLSEIPYAKKGRYTANDLLRNKCLYLIIRFFSIIKFKKTKKTPANFPMGEWLYNYCDSELKAFSPELLTLFSMSFLKKALCITRFKTTEENWHILTNPINLNLINEQFKKT